MKLVCKSCDYRFESATTEKGKKCPYCGKKDVVAEPDAEELLGLVDDEH